jgi:hypothetical protein
MTACKAALPFRRCAFSARPPNLKLPIHLYATYARMYCPRVHDDPYVGCIRRRLRVSVCRSGMPSESADESGGYIPKKLTNQACVSLADARESVGLDCQWSDASGSMAR